MNFFLSSADASVRAGEELLDRHEPRGQAGPPGGRAAWMPPYNPFGRLLDGSRFGLAGHSYGAAGVSYVGQWDPRVRRGRRVGQPRRRRPERGHLRQPPPGEQPCPADPLAARRRRRSRSPRWACPPTTSCPRRRTPPIPTRRRSRTQSVKYSAGRRGLGRDHHPRRQPPGLQLHPEPGVRGQPPRRGRDRLVHDRLVRQVRQARPRRRPRLLIEPLAPRRRRRPRSTPTATATCSPSTTAPAWTSASRTVARFDCEDIRPDPMRTDPPSTYPADTCSGWVPAAGDGWPGVYDYVAIDTSPDGG